jgi:tungstate transport system substrate-binding protein
MSLAVKSRVLKSLGLKSLALVAALVALPTLVAAQDAGTKPAPAAAATTTSILVQSTTSTENSGLFKHILPMFTKKTGIHVRVVAVGTGQAIKNARNGDGDVLFVHAKADEEKFVADGMGVKRFDVMYNDFVIVGPGADPAKVAGSKDASASLKAIAAAKAPFASRGDDSGTHKAELALWKAAGVDAKAASGQWYRETGSGMGATLNTAVAMGAYALTDRATWASFKNKGDFKIVVESDPVLFNPYGVILVNPAKHPTVKAKEGQAFVDWLISSEGQQAIASFKVDGAQVFFPSAKPGA